MQRIAAALLLLLAGLIAPAARADTVLGVTLPTLPPVVTTTAAPAQAPGEVGASTPSPTEAKKTEIVWEWDPYYTDVDCNIPLITKIKQARLFLRALANKDLATIPIKAWDEYQIGEPQTEEREGLCIGLLP